jgi:CRP-like cAMP-binding protein
MAEKLTDAFRNAESNFLENKLDEALAGFVSVAKADPNHLWVRFRIGSTFEAMKIPQRAAEVYKALAWHCIKAGYPLLGLVAVKRAMGIQATFEGSLDTLADLYSLESDRIDQNMALFGLTELDADSEVEQLDTQPEKLPAMASQIAQDFADPRYPSQLPAIPLFSMLPTEAFYPILEIMQLTTYAPGETIVNQGDPCNSIFILAHGMVEVSEGREGEANTLARLISGAVFGEMALITDAPRVASAKAVRESDVIELKRDDLEMIAEDLDDITWALAKFTRKRFLNNLLLTSPIFSPFSEDDNREILDRFASVGVPTDEVIIKEGTTSPGLYVILGGEVEVSKFEGDTRVHLARLAEGAVFGEISLVTDSPTTATVQAVRGGEFLFLSREDFQELVQERPEIGEALSALSDERLDEQKQALAMIGETSADGSVIF